MDVNGVTSTWYPVTSGVFLGPVLSQALFNSFTNGLDEVFKGTLGQFAVEAKAGTSIDLLEGRMSLQKVLD